MEYEVGDRFIMVEGIPKEEIDFESNVPETERAGLFNFPVAKVEAKTGDEMYPYKISIEDMVFEVNLDEIKTIKIVDRPINVGDKIFITNSRSLYNTNKGELYQLVNITDSLVTLKNLVTEAKITSLVKFINSNTYVIISEDLDIYTFPEFIPDEVVNIDDNINIERFVDEDDELYLYIKVGDNIKKLLQKGAVTKETRNENYGGINYHRYLIKNYIVNRDYLKILWEKNIVDSGETKIKIDSADVVENIKNNIESYLKSCLESIFKNKEKIVCEYRVRLVR